MTRPTVLITGANGFVGTYVSAHLSSLDEYSVRAAVRSDGFNFSPAICVVRISSVHGTTDWSEALAGVDVVVHAAGRAHVMVETADDPLIAFRKVNVDGTLNLANQSAKAGVKRFIFISSIKVNGDETTPGNPFFADDTPHPADAYGVSKMEAEIGLMRLSLSTPMEVVIVRPVLVYGEGVKGNFLSMMRMLSKRIPLPFGAIDNRRSLVSLNNLTSLILECIENPCAANQTFLVSDGDDLSTTDLLRRISVIFQKHSLLLPIPVWLLKSVAALLGQRKLSQRLLGSLQVDIKKNHDLLGWSPPSKLDECLEKAARHFLDQKNR